MPLADAADRAHALDPAGSFLVQAPAGSGKTELLIQRYLTLLARVEQPESVLAITFTKKAAGEMRQRVLSALEGSKGPQPAEEHKALTWRLARVVSERDRLHGWLVAENPHRLSIRTIDSLTSALTRRMPWLSRFGAPPTIFEEASELYKEAARATVALLEDAELGRPVERVLTHLDNDVPELERLLATMLARRDQWLRHIAAGRDAEAMRPVLESALRRAVESGLRRVRDAAPPGIARELSSLAAFAGANLENPRLASLQTLPGTDAADLEAWCDLAGICLTGRGEWRKRPDVRCGFPPGDKKRKRRMEELLAALSEEEAFRAALDDVRVLPPPAYSDEQWEVVSALVALLPLAAAQLVVVFRERGAADFTEVAMAALRALGEPDDPTDFALALDYEIRHILVDEFQDTSAIQYELLRRLTAGWERGDGRTLFLVGDPMQSIYRFREAEVGLFLKAAHEGIGAVRLELLKLRVNLRSQRDLVGWANAAFPRVLPPEEDAGTGAVPFHASVPRSREPGGAVRVHAFLERDDEGEAGRVVEIVRDAQARKLGCTILVRSRSHLPSILRALRSEGLRYRAVEIDNLADVPVIQDLLSLTRALLHLADRVAWLSLLRAPWCGLSLADLDSLAGDRPYETVWELMRDNARVSRLSAEGQVRLRRVREALQAAFEKRLPSLRAWVEGAWLTLGGPACSTDPAAMDNARAFFDLLEKADEGGDCDLGLLTEKTRLLYASPDPGAGDSIQVMSIHKAKGLEFDVVVVPGAGRQTPPDEQKLLLWLERPGELLLAPIKPAGSERDPIYEYLKRVEASKEEHEEGRLLYVAATRARHEFHLLGHARLNSQGVVRPEPGSLLEKLWPVVESEFQPAGPVATAAAGIAAAPVQMLKRLPWEWRLPEPPCGVTVAGMDLELNPAAREEVTFEWVGDTLRHIGTVVHRALQQIAREGAALWNRARIRQRRPVFEAALLGLGMSPAEAASAADRVEEALVRTLEDSRGAWVLNNSHQDARSEYALTGVLEGEIVSVRLDRTFIDGGARWIVDFKTSSHTGGDVEAFLDNERERYRGQLERYRALLAQREPLPVRVGLYFPLLGGWREVEQAGATGQ